MAELDVAADDISDASGESFLFINGFTSLIGFGNAYITAADTK